MGSEARCPPRIALNLLENRLGQRILFAIRELEAVSNAFLSLFVIDLSCTQDRQLGLPTR